MTPLDLTVAAPRSPYETLGVVVMLARTIDKFRAAMPGGNLGAYNIAGFSARLLNTLEIAEDAFAQRVAAAERDEEIAEWVMSATTAEQRERAASELHALTIGDRLESEAFRAKYPVAATLTRDTAIFDLLLADDAAAFA